MPVLHLTDIAVRALKPTDGYVSYWDDTTPGFGIRVGKRSKTWMVILINHAPPVLDDIYDRYDRIEEKREALAKYEDFIQTLVAQG